MHTTIQSQRGQQRGSALFAGLVFWLLAIAALGTTLLAPARGETGGEAIASEQPTQQPSDRAVAVEPPDRVASRPSTATDRTTPVASFCTALCAACQTCDSDPGFAEDACEGSPRQCRESCESRWRGSRRRVASHERFLASGPSCRAIDRRF